MSYSLLYTTYHNYSDLAGGHALTSSCNRNSFGSQWLISTDHRSKKTAQPSLPLVFGQGWKINSSFVIVVDEKIKTHVIIGYRPYTSDAEYNFFVDENDKTQVYFPTLAKNQWQRRFCRFLGSLVVHFCLWFSPVSSQ